MIGLLYDRKIPENFNDLQLEQQKTLTWTGSNKKVLEIGCHTGYLSCWLRRKNNLVTGIECNQDALEIAKPYLKNAICGNIENESTWKNLGSEKFDVILIMHVLEHLVDPWKVLEETKKYLKEDGEVIIAMPNISNFYNRWSIFRGNFDYEDVGVMDRTHLRFFNIKTTKELIEKSGYIELEYFSPWQASFFSKIRLLWRLGKYGVKFTHWLSPNLSDIIMMYRLKVKSN